MALENFRLAQDIAEKLEAERRTTREMEIAKEVQTRLLPQTAPRAAHARMRRAMSPGRARGWRLLRLSRTGPREGRTGSGRCLRQRRPRRRSWWRISRPHLRSLSQLTHGAEGLAETLQQVNRILWKSTAAEHYATLFVGIYDDSTRRLTYVNCGHTPPILLRADGRLERLPSTATVIGMFETWECEACEIQLAPGISWRFRAMVSPRPCWASRNSANPDS